MRNIDEFTSLVYDKHDKLVKKRITRKKTVAITLPALLCAIALLVYPMVDSLQMIDSETIATLHTDIESASAYEGITIVTVEYDSNESSESKNAGEPANDIPRSTHAPENTKKNSKNTKDESEDKSIPTSNETIAVEPTAMSAADIPKSGDHEEYESVDKSTPPLDESTPTASPTMPETTNPASASVWDRIFDRLMGLFGGGLLGSSSASDSDNHIVLIKYTSEEGSLSDDVNISDMDTIETVLTVIAQKQEVVEQDESKFAYKGLLSIVVGSGHAKTYEIYDMKYIKDADNATWYMLNTADSRTLNTALGL